MTFEEWAKEYFDMNDLSLEYLSDEAKVLVSGNQFGKSMAQMLEIAKAAWIAATKAAGEK